VRGEGEGLGIIVRASREIIRIRIGNKKESKKRKEEFKPSREKGRPKKSKRKRGSIELVLKINKKKEEKRKRRIDKSIKSSSKK